MAGLYPNTPFADGQVVTADLFDLAFMSPIFDNQPQYLGHRNKILDTELSDTAGQLKSRIVDIEASLAVTPATGLNVNVAGGKLIVGNAITTVIPTVVTVPDNATSYVYLTTSNTVAVAVNPPVLRRLLASVIAASGSVTAINDFRHVSTLPINPNPLAVFVFGGQSSNDVTVTSGQVLSGGTVYCKNFSIPSGISCTCPTGYLEIIASGTVTIAGTITMGSPYSGAIRLDGGYQPSSYTPPRLGAGLGSNGSAYSWSIQPSGSGGRGGTIANYGNLVSNTTVSGAGGSGGGSLIIKAAGAVAITGTVLCDGGNAQNSSVSNTWALSTSNSILVPGSGGGSGGLIRIASITSVSIGATATLSVKGGDGGSAAASVTVAQNATLAASSGGGGGAGGFVVIQTPSGAATILGTLVTTGGLAGAGSSTLVGISAFSGAGFANAGGSEGTTTTNRPTASSGSIVILQETPLS